MGAEGVACVPVEEGTRLGVDCGCGGGEGGVHATFDEAEVAGREGFDQSCGGGCDAAFGGDIEGEVWSAVVVGVVKARGVGFVETKEEELGDGGCGFIGCNQVFFRL